jgi:hypothetical protein
MGRLGCEVWAGQNGAIAKAKVIERATVDLRMISCLRTECCGFRAKEKFTPKEQGSGFRGRLERRLAALFF